VAHGPKPHPETDASGDTTEFDAVEVETPERVSYELRSGTGVRISRDFSSPIEIRVGQTAESSPLFVHQGTDFPDLCAAEGQEPHGAHVLIQPDVFENDPERGWMVISEWSDVGRQDTPQFKLGRDISRKGHVALGPTEGNGFEIVGASANPTKVTVESREHRFWNYDLSAH
jgi:hypothetical protein